MNTFHSDRKIIDEPKNNNPIKPNKPLEVTSKNIRDITL